MSWEVLLPYAAWLGSTPFALWLGPSTWRIAGLLSVHLFGLTLLLGSVIITSLNLLGLFQRGKPPARLRREVRPVLLTGLTLSMVTGALIFTGGAQPYYEGYWFRLKMVLLAITLHLPLHRLSRGQHRSGRAALRRWPTAPPARACWCSGSAWPGRGGRSRSSRDMRTRSTVFGLQSGFARAPDAAGSPAGRSVPSAPSCAAQQAAPAAPPPRLVEGRGRPLRHPERQPHRGRDRPERRQRHDHRHQRGRDPGGLEVRADARRHHGQGEVDHRPAGALHGADPQPRRPLGRLGAAAGDGRHGGVVGGLAREHGAGQRAGRAQVAYTGLLRS